jgi:hypothetical protein
MIEMWLSRSRELAVRLVRGEKLFSAWQVLLKFIWEHQYAGACHDTSAVFYILLSELGFSPILNIGEVRAPEGIFDHSWVDLDGLIFDAAVCLPQDGGVHVSGPVFASIDLTTNKSNRLTYGVISGQGLEADALPAASLNFSDYASIQPKINIWVLSVALAGRIGLDLTFSEVEARYGLVRRNLVGIQKIIST